MIDFSDAYAPFFNGVFGPADTKVAKPTDLAGKVLGVTRFGRGSGTHQDRPGRSHHQSASNNNATISAYLTGQVIGWWRPVTWWPPR